VNRPTQTDIAVSSEASGDGMSRDAIEELLAELAAVAEEVIAQADAADARMNELSDASEALLDQRVADGVPRWRPDPQHAIVSLRDTLATNAAREHRNAAREFVAWWADVATLAVLAAVTGQRVPPTRVAAADPTIWFAEEDLHHLPDVPERTRELARLAAEMAATPLGHGQADHDMATLARDHAARAGLRISYTDNGQVVVKQDGSPEARRRRLWGDAWTEARVPALPAPDELAGLLTSYGAPASTITAVVDATRAVDDAVTALLRAQALEDSDTGDEPTSTEDSEVLWNQAEQLTALLSRYARTLTNTLPVLRTGDETQ
jgi:hypothetical protein